METITFDELLEIDGGGFWDGVFCGLAIVGTGALAAGAIATGGADVPALLLAAADTGAICSYALS